MKFVELTDQDGKVFLVNTAHIMMLKPIQDERHPALVITTDNKMHHVKEPIPEILTKINQTNEI
jgi:hypothetical protein